MKVVDVRNTTLALVAIIVLRRRFALRRDALERAARKVTDLAFLAAHRGKRRCGGIEAIRLETLDGGHVIGATEGEGVLRGLVAQNELLIDLILAEGADSG